VCTKAKRCTAQAGVCVGSGSGNGGAVASSGSTGPAPDSYQIKRTKVGIF
jgi:hypothetical protein